MIEQLKELLEMQKVLDQSIFDKKGITEYPEENMKIALFVELGELMNELPTLFKHWKSSAEDNREKALVEYVDCLHFCLSLTNNKIKFDKKWMELKVNEYTYESYWTLMLSELSISNLMMSIVKFDGELQSLFALGIKLGFTWDEIYKSYKDKNEINYKRLASNY